MLKLFGAYFFTPESSIIIVLLCSVTQLVLSSPPWLRSNCMDQLVHYNESGWKLPAPLLSCGPAVLRDIHLPSLVWLVNLGWRETLPLLIASVQRAALSIVDGHSKLCLCHHNQTVHLNCATQLHREIPPLALHCYLDRSGVTVCETFGRLLQSSLPRKSRLILICIIISLHEIIYWNIW